MSENPKTRTQLHEIEIKASIEAVWKALTDAEELTRWFVEEARVTPGPGGKIWGSWGEGMSGEKQIEVWEPGQRLRLLLLPSPDGQGPEAMLTSPIVEEYTLESRGGRCVLRLVYSGVPHSRDWDGFYDGTDRGWTMFFYGLRHYLERHAGRPRKNVLILRPLTGAIESAWRAIMGRDGFCAEGRLDRLGQGSRYSVLTSAGEPLEGVVILNDEQRTFCATLENLKDSLLSLTFEEMQGTAFFYLTLATFGWAPEEFEALRERWTGWLERVLPAQ